MTFLEDRHPEPEGHPGLLAGEGGVRMARADHEEKGLLRSCEQGEWRSVKGVSDHVKRFGVTLECAGIQCPDDKPYIWSIP